MLERRFGRAVKMPSTIQLKHQILLEWLADQTRREASEKEPLYSPKSEQMRD